jgi:hypothetical protein
VNLPVRVEQKRSRERDEESSAAARGDRQIESGQPARAGLRARELAVADHAPGKERRRVGGHLNSNGHDKPFEENQSSPSEGERESRSEDRARIDPIAFEAQDEGNEIKAKRYDPEKRNRRDLLAHLIRRREKQSRAAGREQKPEEGRRAACGRGQREREGA